MLSARGNKYAMLDLAAGYNKQRGDLYDKERHPDGLVSLPNAFNFLMHEEMLTFIKTKFSTVDATALTYHEGPFGSKRLREAMAEFVNANFSPVSTIEEDLVSFVSGVTALNEVLSLCLTEENEGLLLGMPIYGTFSVDLTTQSNCKLKHTPFGEVDQFSVHAVKCYDEALAEAERSGIRIRALVIANPHNPLGRCYSKKALEALMRFCNKHNIHLISDEIYAMTVYHTDNQHPGFTSVLSIEPSGIIDPNLVHVMYGLSKDFAVGGLRLGCLISRNTEMTKAVRSLARFHCASPLTDAIATTILEDKQFHTLFLAKSRDILQRHQLIATNMLNEAGIPYSPNPNAGFFLWIDLSKCLRAEEWEAEDELKQALYDAGLELETGKWYHEERPGHFRFIFSVDKETLEEGLRRLISFFKSNARKVLE